MPRYLPEGDYRRLEALVLQATEAETSPACFDRACFLTLAHVGMRVSELLNLRLADRAETGHSIGWVDLTLLSLLLGTKFNMFRDLAR